MSNAKIFTNVKKFILKFRLAEKFVEDIEFLFKSVKENPIKYGAIVTVALAYLLNPADAVPDIIPVAGLADDAAVIAAAVAAIKRIMRL